MTGSTLLELEDIRMNFGAIEALNGVSRKVGRGGVVALPGDNGAGKSTLVKIMSGGLKATGGRMMFNGAEQFFATPADVHRLRGGVPLKAIAGKLPGVHAGVLLLSSIHTAINLMGLPARYTRVMRGLLVLAAVLLDTLKLQIRQRFA